MPETHAYLSASKAYQWLECTPSAALNAKFPETQSPAAAEGTLAHSIVEHKLRRMIVGLPRGETPEEIRANPLWCPAMDEYVDQYLDYVDEKVNEFKAKGVKDPVVYSEIRLDLSEWVPEGFGTADTVIIADGTMAVIDFKYGKGVPVDAVGNPQLRLYGCGAVNEFSLLYDIERVQTCIVQPRIDNNSEEELSVVELMAWAQNVVRPRARMAMDGVGTTHCGPHCKFCKASAICPAKYRELLDAIDWTTRNPKTMTMQEAAEVLPMAKSLASWTKELEAYMEAQALSGEEVPGYKLVAGRSVRKITDESAACSALEAAGCKNYLTLKGLTALEETVGKKRLAEVLGDLIVKPEGKPTLVPASDKRPAINAGEMFKEEE